MLKLSGRVISLNREKNTPNHLYSISTNRHLPTVLRTKKGFLVSGDIPPPGFGHYFFQESSKHLIETLPTDAEFTILPADFDYLGDRDVIRLNSEQASIRVLFRANSPHNSILVTEQCNHYCLMCSQPPKDIDDSYLLDDIEQLLPLIPRETVEIGFTGGEPTLHGDRFLKILRLTKNYLPDTSIHILSNGRKFKDVNFCNKYAAIDHHDIMVGIPLYSDDASTHNYIVQSENAFDETLQGIINLKRLHQKVEIRIVIHKLSVARLVNLCEFIARNLVFVDHVALMGLEMTGFTRANLEKLWIDPSDYTDILSSAVNVLKQSGLNTSVYNHQLCLVNNDIIPFYRKSISDWKNEYVPECHQCTKKNECGGFFSSGAKFGYSKKLKPFL
jgi:His-Xaa-Ser system radical SAM maturase HxsC